MSTFAEICIKLEQEFRDAPALYTLSDNYLPLSLLSEMNACKIPSVINMSSMNNSDKYNLEDHAAKKITKFIRKNISHDAYNYMFTSSPAWCELTKNYPEKGLALIRRLSQENISNLRQALSPLDNEEKAFLETILTIKLRATHVSNANLINKNNILGIYSRRLLIEKEIPFPKSHSDDDSHILANEDFVFFSLEPGEEPKKASSRFGFKLHSFDLNQPVFEQVSSINLYDQINEQRPDPKKHIDGLSEEATETLRKKESSVYNFMFFGKDLRAGLGLYLLKRIRAIPQRDRQKILAMKGEHELNRVINGILRPEIKVPKYFFSKEYTSVLFDDNGGFVDPRKTNDKNYMLEKINASYNALIHCSDDLKNDVEIALAAVSQEGVALKYVSDELKKNRDIVLAAVKTTGSALEFSDEEFKGDKEVVLTAARYSCDALDFASQALKNDRGFLFAAVQQSSTALMFFPDKFTDDEELVKIAVKKNGQMLHFASDRLKDDKDLVQAAVQNDYKALLYCSARLRDDEDFIKEAVQNDFRALILCSDRLKDNPEIVLLAVQHCGRMLQYTSERLQDDILIVSRAIKNDRSAIVYASERIQKRLN
ncbi:TPA: DUF4116 domain-containing protein [Salmonella enterica]|nr:DUF4116 domain-containing protein [Salmonella enterica]